MGDTIWVLRESQADAADDSDHSLMLAAADELDALAESLGQEKLSAFFDDTDLQLNLAEEDLPEGWLEENRRWHAPAGAIATLKAVLPKLREQGGNAELLEELQDCLRQLKAAQSEGDRFHFCIVM